ncbi:MAG: hypothetical protein LBF54_03080 [Holosporaceae bacterium]|jgi:hypothetical protein|nr:hypothetical protein [Holosporaceae bacterium]
MYKVLFYLFLALLLEITVGNFQNFVFAEDDENEEEEDDGEGDGEEDANDGDRGNKAGDTKNRVHSIVDGLLKINKSVDSTRINAKTPQVLKEQGIDKQISNLRKDLDRLDKTLDRHYGGTEEKKHPEQQHVRENASPQNLKNKEAEKPLPEHSKQDKTYGMNGHKTHRTHRMNRYKTHSHSRFPSLSNRIYTVKNVRLSRNATNRYISHRNAAGSHRAKYYGKKSHGIGDRKIEYKIKSFAGKNHAKIDEIPGAAEVNSPNGKLTVKSKSYFGNRSKCASTGCAG